MSESNCPHCNNETIGSYCHHCGQNQQVQRLTWKYLVADLQEHLFGFNNKYLRTVKDLTIRPGMVAKSIISGVRVKYVGPVGYYFIMLSIYILLLSMLNVDLGEFTKPLVSEADSEFERNFQKNLFSSIFGNFRITSFVMAPFFILGVWLLFKNKKYNFLETSVLYFYGQGHTMILSIMAICIYYFFNDINYMSYLLPISILYFGFVCATFYSGNVVWNFIKSFLGLLLGYLILMILFMVGLIVYIFFNPEIIEQMKQQGAG